ncbi:MAG: hypothetical protein U0168_17285 [Nannocystaceae bacterium]
MRRSPRLLLSLLLLAPVACKHDPKPGATTPGTGGVHGRQREAPPPPSMPRPYSLAAKPAFASHVAAPAPALAALGQTLGLGNDPRAVLRELLGAVGLSFERQLVDDLDLARPWSAALVEGQLVVQVPIERVRLAEVQALLRGKKAVGKFGAVELPREAIEMTPPPPKLAWLDTANATLALASDERGLATARELGRAYGKHGLYLTLDGAEVRKGVPSFPFQRIGLVGEDVTDFRITADGDGPIAQLSDFTEGALTGLLASPSIVAAASSRYAKYQTVVKDLIGQATRTVDKQNFLVKGVLEDMLKRYNAVLRSWNGRVLVGLGPKRHVLLALGADDPKKASGAVGSLIDAVLGNLDLARTFGVSVPKLRFKRNRSTAAGVSIHVIAVDNARKLLPPELAPLIDDEGALRIAFAGSEHAGAVVVAVGPSANEALGEWLEQTKGATPGSKTTEDLLSAAFAIEGEMLSQLRGLESLAPLLGLTPARAPTHAVVTRKGDDFDVHVTGPMPRVVASRNAAAARPPRTAPPRSQ